MTEPTAAQFHAARARELIAFARDLIGNPARADERERVLDAIEAELDAAIAAVPAGTALDLEER